MPLHYRTISQPPEPLEPPEPLKPPEPLELPEPLEPPEPLELPPEPRNEVQSHGFIWERELITKVYGATELFNYTSKIDLPKEYNRIGNFAVSIKTSNTLNSVCMADCLRVYDEVGSGNNIHLTVIFYEQLKCIKKIIKIVEVDITNSQNLLFGNITRLQIEELVSAVKNVPQKRKPTPDEYNYMYGIKNKMQSQSGAIRFDIKCNSTQSRLQCSFNHFTEFINNNPERIVIISNSNEFRGKKIASEIISQPRKFKAQNTQVKQPE